MSTPSVQHPLVDAGGPGWVGTETRADVVALTTGMSDFLHRVVEGGDRPVIVSGEYSRMTWPLAELLTAAKGHWVVRTRNDGCYDARTGARLEGPEHVVDPQRAVSPETVHPAFVRAAVASRLQLVVTASTRHRVSRPVRLGGALEAAAEQLTGEAPSAWGALEPVVASWDRDDLTERSRRRIPLDSHWTAVGGARHPFVGTIRVSRTSEGLEETTRVWADFGTPGDERGAGIAQGARELLARIARIGMPLIGVAFAAIGAPDLSRRSSATPQPEPLALLIGPPGVRALGVDPRAWISRVGGTTVGSPRLPGTLIPLGSPEGGGWQRLSEVLSTLDPARLSQLLALAPDVSAQLRKNGGA